MEAAGFLVFFRDWSAVRSIVEENGCLNPNGTPRLRLTPDHPRRMLGEAIRQLKMMPRDASVRADAFEMMAQQIEIHSIRAWNAARGLGEDGSHIFLGRQGETIVIAPDGGIFKGALGSRNRHRSPGVTSQLPVDVAS